MKRTVKRELGNVLKMIKVKASKKDINLSRMTLHTCEDVQAVLSSASNVVTGLKWKKVIPKMMERVYRNDKVLSVCPVKDCEMGVDLLLMTTDKKVVVSSDKFTVSIYYDDIIYLGRKQGVVSNYTVIETDEYLIEFVWDNKKLAKFTNNILFSKVRGTTTTMSLEEIF